MIYVFIHWLVLVNYDTHVLWIFRAPLELPYIYHAFDIPVYSVGASVYMLILYCTTVQLMCYHSYT